MKLNKGRMAVLVAVAIIGLLAIPVFAACPPGTTKWVDNTTGDNHYSSLSAALQHLNAGDIICVRVDQTQSDDYNIIKDSVTIVGDPSTITITRADSKKFEVTGKYFTLRNITVAPPSSGTPTDAGIKIAASNATLENVTFDGHTNKWPVPAVLVSSGNDTLIKDNTFKMSASGTAKPAIELAGGLDTRIDGNTFTGTGSSTSGNDGILASATVSNVTIVNNTFTDMGGAAIKVSGGAFNNSLIDSNTITKSLKGGIVFGGTGTTVSNNTLTTITTTAATNGAIEDTSSSSSGNKVLNNTINGVTHGAGILLNSSNATIKGNTIFNAAAYGINYSAANGTIADNQITGCAGGVNTQGGAGNNTIDNNTINTSSAVAIAGESNDTITNNKINTTTATAGHTSNGIDVPGKTNVTITGNTVIGVAGIGINAGGGGSNFTIAGNTVTSSTRDGIDLGTSTNGHVTGNTVSGGLAHGINIDGTNNYITGNKVKDNAQEGIRVADNNNHITGKNIVTGNGTDSDHEAGILIEGSDNNLVDGNTVGDNGNSNVCRQIYVTAGADNNTISNNTVTNTKSTGTKDDNYGIDFRGGDNNVIQGNTVKNSGTMKYGIYVVAAGTNNKVIGNTVEGMRKVGLFLASGNPSNPLIVKGNTLTNNVTGLSLAGGAANIGSKPASATDKNTITGGATAILVESGVNAINFHVNGNCIDAPVFVNNTSFGTLDATGNYWATAPQMGINVFGNVDTSNALSSCPSSGGGTPPPGSSCCTYQSGWNLISMPVTPTDPMAIPPILTQYPFLHYEPGTGYQKPTKVLDTEGYWLYVPPSAAPLKVCVNGTSLMTDQTITLANKGWHQIGTGIEGAYWANTKITYNGITKSVGDAASAGWIIPSAFEYDTQAGSYAIAAVFHVCQGYWVYTYKDNVTLTIPFNQPAPPSSSSLSIKELPAGLTPPPPPLPELTETTDGLEFTNEPNPVTDVHTTTFVVKGTLSSLVKAVKVEIFDLSGRLVYESPEVSGASFDWRTENNYGEYLANGIYLYRMYALINGQWIVSKVKALAILR